MGRDRQIARLAHALIALALLLRIAVPAGWMPATDGFGLMPCFGTVAANPTHAAHAGHHAAHHDHRPADETHDHPCAFAGFAAALIAPDLIGDAIAPIEAVGVLVTIGRAAVTIGHGLAAAAAAHRTTADALTFATSRFACGRYFAPVPSGRALQRVIIHVRILRRGRLRARAVRRRAGARRRRRRA